MTNRIAPHYEPILTILECNGAGEHQYTIDPRDVAARRERGLRTDYQRFEVEETPDEPQISSGAS
ncbi:MAG: hypothetical protein CMJ50_01140 [Planctomycetaceae bacterium]|jgi:hypothetical protein|nr:hypothetical protein [Planctomycetaceae bacterium]